MGSIKHIVVVDDDEGTRFILGKYLETNPDYMTVLLSSGVELLDYLKNKKPDLILLDIEMPGLSGIEVFDQLKRRNDTNRIPVLFLTGKEDKNTVLKCISKGADGYMVKPVLRKKLIEKMDEILNKYDSFKSNKTILMVDDDVEYLKISKIKLSKFYKVLTVNSSKTAIEYLASHQVDLIILDYCMPLYDGKSVLTILRKRENTKNTPVIIASAVPRDEVEEAFQALKVDGIVTKPVDLNYLLSLIHSVLE